MSICILHLGSNIGDRQSNLTLAYELISKEIGQIVDKSRIYQTEPWGIEDQGYFLNSCLKLVTDLNPFEVLEAIRGIELAMGRTRTVKWGPRIIDIDIIFYGDLVLKSSSLWIPHKHYKDRNFVLMPLLDVAGDFIDPERDVSVKSIATKVIDPGKVELFPISG
jgi:2-amino-4-hydroxy-6-hydroxymethyldihydropteridine diphosphokinase